MALKVDGAAPQVRKSFRRTEESALVGNHSSIRRSVRPASGGSGGTLAVSLPVPDVARGGTLDPEASYQQIITEATQSVGHGATEGAFPEEWDAQLLVDCGFTALGHRLVLFCPRFLAPVLDDPDDLDRAFRFILLEMHGIALHEKYVFVYCYLGMDWSDPRLAQRLRLAYDILPEQYAKNLQCLYILHPTNGFRLSMWTLWSWMSKSVWEKVTYVADIDQLCKTLQPGDSALQGELRRRFPQIVQRRDAEIMGREAPVCFGVPLSQICSDFGVDFTDRTTGRWYRRLPPAIIFLCEAMEREAADEDFPTTFESDAENVYKVVQIVDEGRPLDHNIPMSSLWCVLKLFLDCLPSPLLTFGLMDELKQRQIGEADVEAHHKVVAEVLHHRLSKEEAYVALYTASFLHTLCENAREKREANAEKVQGELLCPKLAAKVFGPCFLRPMKMSQDQIPVIRVARAVVETFIRDAEDPEFWIGTLAEPLNKRKADESSSDDEPASSK